MDSIMASYFALFEVINHSFGEQSLHFLSSVYVLNQFLTQKEGNFEGFHYGKQLTLI